MQQFESNAALGRISAEVDDAVTRRVQLGHRGRTAGTTLAVRDGWIVEDVLCTSGPNDEPFEERHSGVAIAVVLAGTFQYRIAGEPELMTPGSVLLGNDGQCFQCGHEHASGDRCVAFHFAPDYFERIAFDALGKSARGSFDVGRLPPRREVARVSARAAVGLLGASETPWDELTLELAAAVLQLANGVPFDATRTPRVAEARVSDSVRWIERDPAARRSIQELAREARLSPFHYLRTFARVTGVTPHQFILRTRLREAAARLSTTREHVLEVALGTGFDDLSNFNRTFRAEFGMTPREYRRSH